MAQTTFHPAYKFKFFTVHFKIDPTFVAANQLTYKKTKFMYYIFRQISINLDTYLSTSQLELIRK